jgi:hypothetical protein
MKRDFFDPAWEDTSIVLIDLEVLRQAEDQVLSCESCLPKSAQVPFDWLLDWLTNSDSSITDYLLPRPAVCPRCKAEILEKTLVDLDVEYR